MVWQPTQRVWAGDDLKVNPDELEADAMEGVESTQEGAASAPTGVKSATGTSGGSARSQSMSISATASVSGVEADEDEA